MLDRASHWKDNAVFPQSNSYSRFPPLKTPQQPKLLKKPKKVKKHIFGGDLMPMMMMMQMMGKNRRNEPDEIDLAIQKKIAQQQAVLNSLKKPQQDQMQNRRMLERIRKLEKKIDDTLAESAPKNPVMDLFFLQNIMMSQNSLSSQFDPENDDKSKNLQGFMMSQMMRQMMGVRNKNSEFVLVLSLITTETKERERRT